MLWLVYFFTVQSALIVCGIKRFVHGLPRMTKSGLRDEIGAMRRREGDEMTGAERYCGCYPKRI